MRLRKFIKWFSFGKFDFDSTTLMDGVRIDPIHNYAVLGSYDSVVYPTDNDLYLISKTTSPSKVKQWLGFEAVANHFRRDGQIVTSLAFRLTDGTDQYYWNGATWVVSVSDWNTEEEVSVNISSFTHKTIGFVVNLKTADRQVTPQLCGIKLLFGAYLDSEIEDAIERSLVPLLRTARPVTRLAALKVGSNNTISLSDYSFDADYRIVSVDSVFNHEADPDHDNDLLESFTTKSSTDPWIDGTVDEITLSALVVADTQIWLELRYEPVVSVETNTDWYQPAHVPAVVIDSVRYNGNLRGGVDYVANKGIGAATCIPAPAEGDLVIGISGMAGLLIDSERLASEITRVLDGAHSLVVTGLDESYTITVTTDHDFTASANNNDLHAWRKTILISNFRVWSRDDYSEYLVTQFRLMGDLSLEIT